MRLALSQVVRTKAPEPVAETQRLSEPDPYVAGEIIADKYRLIRRLGEGGMGAVWVAKNLALDVQVALKLIRTDVDTEGADERLLTEARATARLKHPNIVRVFDFGRTRRSDPYIVMELLQGETLGDVLDREGRLSATFSVQLLLPCADALAAAHSKGIVHRDLKPDNVFLADSDGHMQPKVVDFGIAKFELEHRDHKLTQAGTVLGSPDYMSPEQARGLEDIDHRADVWAFCVVLYECVTGRVPFEDANYNALLRHIIEDEIPSSLQFAAGDSELWRILKKGFSKDRETRYQSMRSIGEDLAAWLMMHGVTEDVSGHSLRAAWLDPTISRPDGFGRLSLPSFSGATIPPPSASGAHPLHPGASQSLLPERPPKRRLSWVLGAAVLIGLVALGAAVGILATRGANETSAELAAPAAPAEPPRSTESERTDPAPPAKVAAPATTEAPQPEPSETDPEPAEQRPSAAPATATRAAPPPRNKPAEATSGSAPAPPPKKKTPYEDLGF